MNEKERILQRLDELIAEAEAIVSPEGRVDAAAWDAWRVSILPLVAQLAGGSEYYTSFALRANWNRRTGERAWEPSMALAILRRVRDDYAKGYLKDLRELAAAEVFGDFLDMADHLHTNGYHIPAASIAGAVLGDSLRRLHLKHIGQWKGDSSISKLNDALRKAEVYRQAMWRQIQAWGDIRNDADHGHFDKVDDQQVKLMVPGIRDFIARHES